MTLDCDGMNELVEAYALGVLDPAEHPEADLHLAGCERCRAVVDTYTAVANRLPQALAAVSPARLPAAVRSNLFDILDTESGAASPVAGEGKRSPAEGGFLASWQQRAGAIAAGLAILAVTASIFVSVRLSSALDRERLLRDQLAGRLDQRELVLDVIDGRDTQRVFLRSATGETSYGKVYTRPTTDDVVAMTGRIPAPAAGRAYHLYTRAAGGEPELAGTLEINGNGFGLIVFKAPQKGPVWDQVELVLEGVGDRHAEGLVVLSSAR